MQHALRSMVFNFIFQAVFIGLLAFLLGACSSIERPNIFVGIVNPELHQIEGYNFKKDFDDDGHIKPEAKPSFYPLQDLSSMAKAFTIWVDDDPENPFVTALERFKVYTGRLRDEYKNHCE